MATSPIAPGARHAWSVAKLVGLPVGCAGPVLVDTTAATAASKTAAWRQGDPLRVLLALDQPLIVQLVNLTLNHGVYESRTTASNVATLRALTTWQPHLVLVDMDLEGGSTITKIRAPGGRLPIIALTRRGNLETKLEAFDSGADDILTIPFAPEELLARVVALLRRSYSAAVTFTPKIKVGELEIDILNRTVHNGTSELQLSALEQSLLYLLAANAGRLVTREEILDSLWGTDFVAESNVVDRQIRNLRARLRDDWRQPRFIATVPGRGYRFVAPANRSAG